MKNYRIIISRFSKTIFGLSICIALGAISKNNANADDGCATTGRAASFVQPQLLRIQSHAGQMDTDGILSPGEVRNPKIDYDKAQKGHELYGDDRVDNPVNDAAAEDNRYYKGRERERERQDKEDERRRSDEERRSRSDEERRSRNDDGRRNHDDDRDSRYNRDSNW